MSEPKPIRQTTPLLNRTNVRKRVLKVCETKHNGMLTRVSDDFYPKAEAALIRWMNDYVHRLPTGAKHGNLVLKRGIAALDSELVSWCQDCILNFRTQKIKPKLVHVRLLNEDGNVLHGWSFANAIPVKWRMGAFNAQKNEVALETIELSYSYWERERP